MEPSEERMIVERCLPAHLMFLMAEECRKAGFELRSDVMQHLNVAAVSPLARLDMLSVVRLARRTDEVARSLLNELSPDDPRHGLYVCAMFCLKLVDEELLSDRTNQAVLVSLLLLDDIRDDSPDVDGQGVVWRLTEQQWQREAGKLLTRAMLQNLYLRRCN
ncbi:hypothetical protein V3589_10955 [Sinorhizobium fredii]|uniref:hypothetical protein n=1 Tax=Rhizobium fredii TaxID=380 RepID=UPI0030958301